MSFEVQSAALVVPDSSPVAGKAMSPAQKNGLKYQAKVGKVLLPLYRGRILLGPWFRYKVKGEVKKCQPDIVLFAKDQSRATIIEIKYSTTAAAWKQLHTLYYPVVRKAYRIPISLVLITRMFDPAVQFPCEIHQLEGLERLDLFSEEGLGVVSWK